MQLSNRAAQRIHHLVAESGDVGMGLRVKVVGGGCSGLSYKMALALPESGDKVFTHRGAQLVVDRKSFLYVKGTELDYEDGLMKSGFTLKNPNVKRSCGCGESFTV